MFKVGDKVYIRGGSSYLFVGEIGIVTRTTSINADWVEVKFNNKLDWPTTLDENTYPVLKESLQHFKTLVKVKNYSVNYYQKQIKLNPEPTILLNLNL